MYCDVRIGRPGVELALPEAGLGWPPPYGLERLESTVGRAFALDVLLFGRVCGDKEAAAVGWIDSVTSAPESELPPEIGTWAGHSPRLTGDLVALLPKDLPAIKAADERALAAFLDHFGTPGARDRVARFVERRRP